MSPLPFGFSKQDPLSEPALDTHPQPPVAPHALTILEGSWQRLALPIFLRS
jgi:hypothetical protein